MAETLSGLVPLELARSNTVYRIGYCPGNGGEPISAFHWRMFLTCAGVNLCGPLRTSAMFGAQLPSGEFF